MIKPYKIHFPKTSPSFYIGGMAALNLDSGDGGDWHASAAFNFRTQEDAEKAAHEFLCGDGQKLNTNPILGTVGIIDGTEILRRDGRRFDGEQAWIATFERAIADLVIFYSKEKVPKFLSSSELLCSEKQENTLTAYLNKALASAALSELHKDNIRMWLQWQKEDR